MRSETPAWCPCGVPGLPPSEAGEVGPPPNANTIRAPRRVRLSPGKASGSAVTSRGGVPSTVNRLFDRADFDPSWLMTVE
jgi:hypothetical protein